MDSAPRKIIAQTFQKPLAFIERTLYNRLTNLKEARVMGKDSRDDVRVDAPESVQATLVAELQDITEDEAGFILSLLASLLA